MNDTREGVLESTGRYSLSAATPSTGGVNAPSGVNAPNDFKLGEAGIEARKRETAVREVVSGEFATGNGLTALTAPITLNFFSAGANLASTGEVTLWGYVCDPMRLSRRVKGSHAMVATLKRLPPAQRSPGVMGRGVLRLSTSGFYSSRPERVHPSTSPHLSDNVNTLRSLTLART